MLAKYIQNICTGKSLESSIENYITSAFKRYQNPTNQAIALYISEFTGKFVSSDTISRIFRHTVKKDLIELIADKFNIDINLLVPDQSGKLSNKSNLSALCSDNMF